MSETNGAPAERETSGGRPSRARAANPGKIRVGWPAPGAAAVLVVILALWVVPWVSFGVSQEHVRPLETAAFVLVGGGALIALLASIGRDLAGADKDVAEFWRGLLGGVERLRNGAQFRYRLGRECARCRRDRRTSSSLVLVRLTTNGDGDVADARDALEHLAAALVGGLRSSDVVGMVSENELGILAIDARPSARGTIVARLRRTIAAAFLEWAQDGARSGALSLSLGAYTLDPADNAASSVAAARQTLRPVATQDTRAA